MDELDNRILSLKQELKKLSIWLIEDLGTVQKECDQQDSSFPSLNTMSQIQETIAKIEELDRLKRKLKRSVEKENETLKEIINNQEYYAGC